MPTGLVETLLPTTRLGALIDHQTSCAGRQDLQGLQKLDDAIFFVRAERLERFARGESFSRVGEDGLAHRGKFAVVRERTGVSGAPKLAVEHLETKIAGTMILARTLTLPLRSKRVCQKAVGLTPSGSLTERKCETNGKQCAQAANDVQHATLSEL